MISVTCTLPSVFCWRYRMCGGANAPQATYEAADLIGIRSNNFEQVRESLVNSVWGAGGLPQGLPALVELGIAAPAQFASCDELATIDRYTFALPFGITQYAYRLHPTNPRGRVLVWNAGHGEQEFVPERNMPQQALLAGYDVVCVAMPFESGNTDGLYNAAVLIDTEQLLSVEGDRPILGYSTLRLFFEPLTLIVNQLKSEGFARIYLAGVSGGGWTVTWYAALDRRIRRSYPIAGSLPWWALMAEYSPALPGGWETYYSVLYDLASYEDIYALGCDSGRKVIQLCGEDDVVNPGSYIGDYVGSLRDAFTQRFGSDFDAMSDHSTVAHIVSPAISATVLEDIDRDYENP